MSNPVHRLLRFGVYEMNLDTQELRNSGTLVKLSPQPFRLLEILASHAGQIVSREEILQELWGGDTHVDFDRSVHKCINQIRNVLNDDISRPLYVETLPRKGYRFLAPVTSKTITALPQIRESGPVDPATAALYSRPAPSRQDATQDEASSAVTALDTSAAKEAVAAQKAASKPVTRRRLVWALGGLSLVALAIVAILTYRHRQHANGLRDKDTVVLADFANSTGDAVFDDTLEQALRIQLEQSPFLNLVSDQKVNATLKLTGRTAGERLTPEVTRDICQRLGSKAMLVGSIAQLGSQYVVGVQAVNCNTGDVLVEAQEQAASKEDVLNAVDRASLSVRRKLGESLRTVQTFATPVEGATTPSLQALQAYSQGRKVAALQGDTAALPFYKRAVELDPNFAMAYLSLSSVYANLNQPGRAAENARRAYNLREKVSKRERFAIEAFYYKSTTGELERAAETYQLAQQAYPRDPVMYRNLAVILSILGRPEKGLMNAQQALRLEPNSGANYANLGEAYVVVNRFPDAESVYSEAERRKLEGEWILGNRYALAFVEGDFAKMAELVAAAEGKVGTEDVLLATHADTQAWYGKLHRARELTGRAMDSATRNGANETVAIYQVAAALREVESGNRQRARDDAQAAVKLAPDRDVLAMAALALARTGDIVEAENLTRQLDNAYPLDTLVQRYWLPSIRAALALDRKQPDQAIEALNATTALELATPTNTNVVLCPAYLRGQAYLMSRQGEAARVEFQRFIDHLGLVANFQWGALARLGLARAYALGAEADPAARDKAREAYQQFLALWKDADPDTPIYQQAKAEYAGLR